MHFVSNGDGWALRDYSDNKKAFADGSIAAIETTADMNFKFIRITPDMDYKWVLKFVEQK